MIRTQQENRRHNAILKDEDFGYTKAVQETEGRFIKMATDVEDQIFDYFGIITV
jgi:hypothetical protein